MEVAERCANAGISSNLITYVSDWAAGRVDGGGGGEGERMVGDRLDSSARRGVRRRLVSGPVLDHRRLVASLPSG